MTALLVVRADRDVAASSPAREFMEAAGLTAALPERLVRDAAGQPFEPVQLDPEQPPLQQLAYLTRREPIGGAEPQIHDNARQLRDHAQAQLSRALAITSAPPRPLLADLVGETRALKEWLVDRFRLADGDYTATQEQLHRWQDQIGRRSGALGGDMWRWLFGGPERLSLPAAIGLWNKREHQAFERGACGAASEVVAWFLDMTSDLLGRLDQLLAEARGLRTRIEQQRAQRRGPEVFAPWTTPIATGIVADALVGRGDLDGLVAELLQQPGEAAVAPALAERVRVLAQQEAERLLAPLGIADLIALEASAGGARLDDDPLIIVGQDLLTTLQRPTWRLARGARPRAEILQVTPDGAPIYSLDGLASAAYGETQDRLGFVRVQLGVAMDDLALLRDGDEAFAAALGQRNLYVLDDLALAWERAHGWAETTTTVSTAGPDHTHPTNGRVDAPGIAHIEE